MVEEVWKTCTSNVDTCRRVFQTLVPAMTADPNVATSIDLLSLTIEDASFDQNGAELDEGRLTEGSKRKAEVCEPTLNDCRRLSADDRRRCYLGPGWIGDRGRGRLGRKLLCPRLG